MSFLERNFSLNKTRSNSVASRNHTRLATKGSTVKNARSIRSPSKVSRRRASAASTAKKNMVMRNRKASASSTSKNASGLAMRRASTFAPSPDTTEVLISGGLFVRVQGTVHLGVNGKFSSKYLFFNKGVLSFVSEANLAEILARHDNSITPEVHQEVADAADESVNVMDIKSIIHEDRNASEFKLRLRRHTDLSTPAKHASVAQKRVSAPRKSTSKNRASLAFIRASRIASIRLPSLRKSLMAFGLVKDKDREKVLTIRPQKRTADAWVQSILFQIRNQALFMGSCIKTWKKNPAKMNFTARKTLESLDGMHRHEVDLWALAKGKISVEVQQAMSRFVEFLEENIDSGVVGDQNELDLWKEVLELLNEVLAEDSNIYLDGRELDALEQLQLLNEKEEHIDPGNPRRFGCFPDTEFQDKSKSIIHPKRKSSKSLFAGEHPEDRLLSLKELELPSGTGSGRGSIRGTVVSNATAEHARENNCVRIRRLFTSAVEMKRSRDAKTEHEALMHLVTQKRAPNQLSEIDSHAV